MANFIGGLSNLVARSRGTESLYLNLNLYFISFQIISRTLCKAVARFILKERHILDPGYQKLVDNN